MERQSRQVRRKNQTGRFRLCHQIITAQSGRNRSQAAIRAQSCAAYVHVVINEHAIPERGTSCSIAAADILAAKGSAHDDQRMGRAVPGHRH